MRYFFGRRHLVRTTGSPVKQAQELGGNVKKGEKATPAVFWKQLDFSETE